MSPEYEARYEKFYKVHRRKNIRILFIFLTATQKRAVFQRKSQMNTIIIRRNFFWKMKIVLSPMIAVVTEIFVGEYAVNGGNTIASMECALAEAVFLAGAERNQDIVKLTSYAPLFQNSDYTAWKPNLIVFDNHQVYGIPSYHAISMMAENRGKEVLETETQVEMKPPVYKGIPGLMCSKPGLQFKNARINGEAAEIAQTIYGGWKEENGVYTMLEEERHHPYIGKSDAWNKAMEEFQSGRSRPMAQKPPDSLMWVAFGKEDLEEYTFTIDLKFEKDNPVTLSVWNFHPNTDAGCNEPKDPGWNLRSVRNQVWKIENGRGTTDYEAFLNGISPNRIKQNLRSTITGSTHILSRRIMAAMNAISMGSWCRRRASRSIQLFPQWLLQMRILSY